MSRFIYLKKFNDVELIVNENEIVKIDCTKSWGEYSYRIFYTDGREDALNNECGKKLWEAFKYKSERSYY